MKIKAALGDKPCQTVPHNPLLSHVTSCKPDHALRYLASDLSFLSKGAQSSPLAPLLPGFPGLPGAPFQNLLAALQSPVLGNGVRRAEAYAVDAVAIVIVIAVDVVAGYFRVLPR